MNKYKSNHEIVSNDDKCIKKILLNHLEAYQ